MGNVGPFPITEDALFAYFCELIWDVLGNKWVAEDVVVVLFVIADDGDEDDGNDVNDVADG